MKVLLANKYFYVKGGSERVFFQERTSLLEHGHEVVDFSMQSPLNVASPHEKYFVSGIDFHERQSLRQKLASVPTFIASRESARKISELVEATRPQIAHLHNIYHHISPSIIPALKAKNVKIVLTLHDGKVICPSYLMLSGTTPCTECNGRHFHRAITRRCGGGLSTSTLFAVESYWHRLRRTYALVDAVISPSRFLADLAGQRHEFKDKIVVIPNGVDESEFTPRGEDKGYAVYLGRLTVEKGIKTLLEAHRATAGGRSLKIIGTGPLEEQLRGQYPEAEFLGYQSGEALKRLVADAAFVVVPSEWYENCSMSVIEAMALGKPIVGAAIGGIPEQVVHGRTGLLFESGNRQALAEAMAQLWAAPELRARMGQAARERFLEQYTAEKNYERVMNLFTKLLAR